MPRESVQETPDDLMAWVREKCSFRDPDGGVVFEFLDAEIVEGDSGYSAVAYAAVRETRSDGSASVTADVFLIDIDPDAEFTFTWKELSEVEGPQVHSCPERILGMLTEPAPNAWAEEWRDICYSYLPRRRKH